MGRAPRRALTCSNLRAAQGKAHFKQLEESLVAAMRAAVHDSGWVDPWACFVGRGARGRRAAPGEGTTPAGGGVATAQHVVDVPDGGDKSAHADAPVVRSRQPSEPTGETQPAAAADEAGGVAASSVAAVGGDAASDAAVRPVRARVTISNLGPHGGSRARITAADPI